MLLPFEMQGGSMDLAGRHSKRGGGLEKPLVDKVNVEVECDQGGDKSWTRGSWSTHMGLMRGSHLSYNPLNKADPSPMCPTADCVFNQSPLLSNTPALSFSLSLSCPPTPTKTGGASSCRENWLQPVQNCFLRLSTYLRANLLLFCVLPELFMARRHG